jgi:hypothetical protein
MPTVPMKRSFIAPHSAADQIDTWAAVAGAGQRQHRAQIPGGIRRQNVTGARQENRRQQRGFAHDGSSGTREDRVGSESATNITQN